jgi:hypothetical protein
MEIANLVRGAVSQAVSSGPIQSDQLAALLQLAESMDSDGLVSSL